MWTVHPCNQCDDGFIYCLECERFCDHDRICPQCLGGAWFPFKCRDMIDMIAAGRWLYRTKREAWASIDLEYC